MLTNIPPLSIRKFVVSVTLFAMLVSLAIPVMAQDWDVYPHTHLITYPSVYEGFGNALVETVYFRKLLVVNTYPMYLSDIKPAGIRAAEFFYDIDEATLDDTRRLIDDFAYRAEIIEHNYQVGLEHFLYKVLRRVLNEALAKLQQL